MINLMRQSNPFPISPSRLQSWLQDKEIKPYLIDVREIEELQFAPFPEQTLHLPMSDSVSWISDLPRLLSKDQKIVAICHLGVRSWNFGTFLIQQDLVSEVWNLEGGIDAWSVEIDSTVPRY